MLTHLKLDNFKIWKSTGPMRLAPITLLLGSNSSGKSSLIQALLLIRQTVRNGDDNEDLNLGNPDTGDSVALGQYRDVLCQHGSSTQIGIEFRWSATGEAVDSAVFSARYRRGIADAAELDYLRLGKDGQGFIVQRRKPGIYRLLLGDERTSRRQSAEFHPRRSFAFTPAALARLGEDAERIREIGPQLLDELGRIIYLGPVRRLAQRDYVWNGRMPASIGDDGARAVDALIASGIEAQNAKRRNKPIPPEARLLNEAVHWLKAMDLADGLSIKSFKGSSRHELMIHRQGEASNIKDVGVGVSQVLPVIVAALFAEPGHIVIVEEPESHLHPLAETVLADLFIQTSKQRKVQFIVETHSEHLLIRLQRRVAEEETEPEDVAIYFCKRNGTASVLEPIQLTDQGDIKNWPEDFFGDEMEEITARTVAAMKQLERDSGESST